MKTHEHNKTFAAKESATQTAKIQHDKLRVENMKCLLEQFYLNLISKDLNTTAKYFLACIRNLYINTSIPQGNKNKAHSSGIRGYLQ